MDNKTHRFELRLTSKEKRILERKARKLGMSVSEYVRTALIHSDHLNITMIDMSPMEKVSHELLKQGVNLNQLMKFLNTYGVDAYNAEQTFQILTRNGDIYLKVADAVSQLRDEAARHRVYITDRDFGDEEDENC